MVSLARLAAVVVALCASQVLSYSALDRPNFRRHGMHAPNPGVPIAPVEQGNSTFRQLIDHNNPKLGTFSQFYYYTTEYYKGPGSPIIFFTPGEINVTKSVTPFPSNWFAICYFQGG